MTKSMLSTKGFDEYLEKIAQAGQDVDAAASEAVLAGGQVIQAGMEARAPRRSGHLVAKIKIVGPNRDGSYHMVKIGLFNINREKELYFFYQEHGSARNSAHPFLRPSFDEDSRKASAAMKAKFKERGVL